MALACQGEGAEQLATQACGDAMQQRQYGKARGRPHRSHRMGTGRSDADGEQVLDAQLRRGGLNVFDPGENRLRQHAHAPVILYRGGRACLTL